MKRTRLMLMSIVAFAAVLMNVACVEENVGTLSFSLGTPDDGTDPAAVEISSGNYSRIFTISTDAEWSIEKQDDAGERQYSMTILSSSIFLPEYENPEPDDAQRCKECSHHQIPFRLINPCQNQIEYRITGIEKQ